MYAVARPKYKTIKNPCNDDIRSIAPFAVSFSEFSLTKAKRESDEIDRTTDKRRVGPSFNLARPPTAVLCIYSFLPTSLFNNNNSRGKKKETITRTPPNTELIIGKSTVT